MSFGNRGKTPIRRRPSVASEGDDENKELLTWSEKNPGKFQGVVASCVFSLVAVILLISAPHTYAAPRVVYNSAALAEGAMATGLLKEYKEKVEKRLGIDFRRILTNKADETTIAMKRVADFCLPKRDFKNFVMPTMGLQLVYAEATDYLICAMRTERARFCQDHERQRLVEQLNQYAERRQNVLAVERATDRMFRSKMAKILRARHKAFQDMLGEGKQVPALPGRIGDEIDPRVIVEMRQLVRDGLLSSGDFGWLGLYLPEEYAPALSEDVVVNSCA